MTGTGIELKRIVEAALFVADTPLTVQKLLSLFPEDGRPSTEEVRAALAELEQEYADRAIELRRVGGGYRFQSRNQYAPWLRKLWEQRPPRYSRALMETLAIVAYRQPVTRGDIEDIRGVTVSTDIMRTLLDRGWIRQVGTRDVPGRPALFGTTRAFLEYFNLERLSDLPPLAEARSREAVAEDHNLSLPLEATGDEEQPAAGSPAQPDGEPAGEERYGQEGEHLPVRTEYPESAAGPDDGGESAAARDAGERESGAQEPEDSRGASPGGADENGGRGPGDERRDADSVAESAPLAGEAGSEADCGEEDSDDAGDEPDTQQTYPKTAEAWQRGS